MTDDYDLVVSGLVFFGEEVTTERRLGAEHSEETVADALPLQPLRLAHADQVEGATVDCHQALEDGVLFLPFEKVAGGDREFGELRQLGLADHHQAIRL